ncbi:helix-turn-helix domain-containing protein [Streptomyces sp. TRM66268-LWL]|uniref:Helix-turn-helix domain-containing protein n=1 Tax=Streptomyces polyasparticus TaxID=2767826 RepID=A0ABR7SCZ6_9ACTN|nr:helix-turn-helix transcriptional regulator [Streptomyces polyasparticus]MBC9712228.1 helix-turn-helix domain-containing protein [Streptomyces polyasparticus]
MNRSELGTALRALRNASGKEAKAVARSAVMSASKLSKIETGKLAPSADDVDRILTAIGVSDDVKAEYMEAARAVATEATAWRLIQRAGLHKAQQRLRDVEARMSLLRVFQPALVPGLLQTPEYMRAILSRHADLSEATVRETISARLERQQVLYDQTKTLRFVITEPVLRWLIVPPLVMAGQLDRLVTVSRLPNVDVRVVPLGQPQTDIANHAFVIRDDRAVTVETVHAEVVVTDPRDVAVYVDKFEGFARHAVEGSDMQSLLTTIRDDLLRQRESG